MHRWKCMTSDWSLWTIAMLVTNHDIVEVVLTSEATILCFEVDQPEIPDCLEGLHVVQKLAYKVQQECRSHMNVFRVPTRACVARVYIHE